MDHILYLDDGIAKAEGTYRDLQSTGLEFTNLLSDQNLEDEEKSKREFVRRMSSQLRDRTNSIQSATSVDVDVPKEVNHTLFCLTIVSK